MQAFRCAFLLVGLVSLFGGVSGIAAPSSTAPWARLQRHVKQTLGTGGTRAAVRVDLEQSYGMLMRLAGGGS